MARKRSQRTGWLREDKGQWLLTFRQYIAGKAKPGRVTVTIGPAEGAGKLTEKQAQRFSWAHFLEPLDKSVLQPLSTMTLDAYWTQKYDPWLKAYKKKSTQIQYRSLYANWIKADLGNQRFSDLDADMVEALIGKVLAAGKSAATAGHVRKVLGAIYSKAKRSKVAFGDNPAFVADKPQRKPVRARTSLKPAEFVALLDVLPSALRPCVFNGRNVTALWSHPYREIAYAAALTSMNAAELCGLKWQAVNLSDEYVSLGTETIPPYSIAVLEHWKHGEYTTLKTDNRRRFVPMADDLRAMLSALKVCTEVGRPHQPVFASREGTPIDADNVRARYLKPAAESLGLHGIGWHSFRRTHATATNNAGMNARDRQGVMGHGSHEMTDFYTESDLARTRAGLNEVGRRLGETKGTVQ